MKIARYTLTDEAKQKSFIIMFIICAIFIFLVRGCYQGNYMVNGQELDSKAIVGMISRVVFHVIAVAVMLIAALLSMRAFRRDRDYGMQWCVLSKPIARWQYVTGKILGLWVLSIIFMFILHGIIFAITSINLNIFMPEYLVASLLCSFNLLFVIVTVMLLSLLMPDIVAFLCVVGMSIVSFVGDGISALVLSPMGQAMMEQPGSHSDLTWWKAVYYVWPKLSGTQQFATSLINGEGYYGFGSVYPLINILVYCFILCVLLFWRFRKEDIV